MITNEQAFQLGYNFQVNLESSTEFQNGELWASSIFKGVHGFEGLLENPRENRADRKAIKHAVYRGIRAAGRRSTEVSKRHTEVAEKALIESVMQRMTDTEIAMATPHQIPSQIDTDNWYEGIHSILRQITGEFDSPTIEVDYSEAERSIAIDAYELGKLEGNVILKAWQDAKSGII